MDLNVAKLCRNCQTPADENAVYCSKCGSGAWAEIDTNYAEEIALERLECRLAEALEIVKSLAVRKASLNQQCINKKGNAS